MPTPREVSSYLCRPQHKTKLRVLVAAAAHHRVFGEFPTRTKVALLLLPIAKKKQGIERINRLAHVMIRWGVIEIVVPEGGYLAIVRVLDLGFEALEMLLGYHPIEGAINAASTTEIRLGTPN